MSRAQDLHDKIKALTEEFKGASGLACPLTALEGILGHCLAAAKKEANVPAPAVDPAPVAEPSVPPAKPAPAVQVAKPKPVTN